MDAKLNKVEALWGPQGAKGGATQELAMKGLGYN